MPITRRRFLKGAAATGGTLAVGRGAMDGHRARDTEAPGRRILEDWLPTTCWIGKQDCGVLARVVDGRIVKLEGMPDHPRNQGTLCPKGVAQIMAVYDPNRVKTPLIRTNGKGVPGRFRRASWDEALSLVADRMVEARARDPRLVLWQKGRSKAGAFYDHAFVDAVGATKLHHGGFCSDAGYRACEYTIGLHGVLHPDFHHVRYLLAWGWNLTNAGGNKLCWITWPRQLVEAKERGMKLVAVDPRLRGAAHFADEWLPIRPGTDMALALALCRELIARGVVDWEYLAQYTNAPFLVGPDGTFLRGVAADGSLAPEGEDVEARGRTELVWDAVTSSPRPADDPGVTPALTGSYEVDGVEARPAFEVLKDHLRRYTIGWAASVCGVPEEQIAQVAQDIADAAAIGTTAIVDGVELPLRPVAIMSYHVTQQELGFQNVRAMLMLEMILGAVGAAGGQRTDLKWKVHGNFNKLDNIDITMPPYDVTLAHSHYFPINSNNSSLVAKVILDPEAYGVDYTPEVLLIHMSNPLVAYPDQETVAAALAKMKFVAVIDPWLSRTADYYADVVLPAATIEKYEGPFNASDQYTAATALRVPPIEPLFESRGEIDIYLDLCEKSGDLFGEQGYLAHLNRALGLDADHALPLDRKPAVREIYDRWAKNAGVAEGVAFFEQHGVKVEGPVSPGAAYGYAASPPFGGIRHRLYGEALLRYQRQMRARGVDETYWRDYTPLPTWRSPTMNESPPEYSLYLVSYKKIEFKQSRASQIPLLAELTDGQCLDINPATARRLGIADGDKVWVESHNAVTGETRRVQTKAAYREGLRPDTVAMPHHFGGVSHHPWSQDQGPTPNVLFFTGEGYVANTADQSFHVKVRVTKA